MKSKLTLTLSAEEVEDALRTKLDTYFTGSPFTLEVVKRHKTGAITVDLFDKTPERAKDITVKK